MLLLLFFHLIHEPGPRRPPGLWPEGEKGQILTQWWPEPLPELTDTAAHCSMRP